MQMCELKATGSKTMDLLSQPDITYMYSYWVIEQLMA